MSEYTAYYCELIEELAHRHAHPKNKKEKFIIKKKFQRSLDFNETEELIKEAAGELGFVHTVGDYVWMTQNRQMLEYIRDECDDIDLWAIGSRFGHLEPPSLRNEFDLPSRQ